MLETGSRLIFDFRWSNFVVMVMNATYSGRSIMRSHKYKFKLSMESTFRFTTFEIGTSIVTDAW